MKIDQFNFAGKKAIVRVDFNVPLDENGNVTDDTRIRGALPTLKKVLDDGGAVIMMSHMGKPKGKVNPKFSLSQIVAKVSERLGVDVKFAPDCAKADEAAAALKPGEALLLENLRFYAEEEGKPTDVEKGTPAYEAASKAMKESQKEFSKKLASYADVYVNDAFGTAHRKHASTAVIADYFDKDSKMLGFLMEKEVKAIDNVLKNAEHPFTAIIGGSKVSSKLGVIQNLLDKVDNLIIGGGMGYTFIKAQGGHIGDSLHEDDLMPEALNVLQAAKDKGINLSLSVATVAANKFANDAD
ncbi:MAG: phosphoglycerate kinase, partial [Prevotella sp.]|nr:phosphoglycerate kinase [Prevotella sp.]